MNFCGKTGKGLPTPILKGWFRAQKRYVKAVDEACWAYNERASISVLTAGVWLAKGVALEEFSAGKDHLDKRMTSSRVGRDDLYFCHRNTNYWCEAKWMEIAVPTERKWNIDATINALRQKFDDAKKDASVVIKGGGGKRRALLFVSVYHLSDKKDKLKDVYATNLVRECKKRLGKIGATGLAWYFERKWVRNNQGKRDDGKYWWEMGNLLFVGNVNGHKSKS